MFFQTSYNKPALTLFNTSKKDHLPENKIVFLKEILTFISFEMVLCYNKNQLLILMKSKL